MLQITADLSALTPEQREAVSAFILSFPDRNNSSLDNKEEDEKVIIPTFSEVSDEEEVSAADAFGTGGPQLVPTPAATSIAPVVAASPALPTSGAVVLDKNGIPWDERIHAGSRTRNADGTWRNKRGADAALIATVEAELKALMGLPSPAAVPAPPVQVPVAVTPAAAVTPTADDRQAFVKLLGRATDLIQTNKLSQEELTAAIASVGWLRSRCSYIVPI